jgi:hypothetical protein
LALADAATRVGFRMIAPALNGNLPKYGDPSPSRVIAAKSGLSKKFPDFLVRLARD